MSRREEILKAAYEIVGQVGLEGLHARSVAVKVGVNHALVHYYFKTREDLLLGVAGYLLQRFNEDAEHFRHKAASSAQASLMQCEAYASQRSRLYKVWASLFVASQGYPAVKAALQDFWNTWTKELGSMYSKEKSPFADPSMLLATLLGTGLLAHLMENSEEASRQLSVIKLSLGS